MLEGKGVVELGEIVEINIHIACTCSIDDRPGPTNETSARLPGH